MCLRIYELWQERVEEVARILTLEQGKPFTAEAIDDIAEASDYFHIAAEDVKRLSGEVIPTTERNDACSRCIDPVGVWVAVTPWNFPVMIPMEYVGPGLATGNALIVKPPEFTCWALLEMAKVFEEAGVPKGAISVIPGAGEIGEALVTHQRCRCDRVHRLVGYRGAHRLQDGSETVDHGDVGQRSDDRDLRRRHRTAPPRPPSMAPTTTQVRCASPPSVS